MHSMSFVMIGLVVSGLALGFQEPQAQPEPPDQLTVVPIDRDRGISQDAMMLGMGEYHCHWTRFQSSVMAMFTNASIEFSETAETFLQSVEGDDSHQLLREFTNSRWDELGSELGRIALANGLDDNVDWVDFARTAGWQLTQRIMAGENNWPYLGNMLADQAVKVAQAGQNRVWERFGRAVGSVMNRGTETQWTQWGLQVALQARARSGEPEIDWKAFGAETLEQAQWFADRHQARPGVED